VFRPEAGVHEGKPPLQEELQYAGHGIHEQRCRQHHEIRLQRLFQEGWAVVLLRAFAPAVQDPATHALVAGPYRFFSQEDRFRFGACRTCAFQEGVDQKLRSARSPFRASVEGDDPRHG
jgi:hypothetical protein